MDADSEKQGKDKRSDVEAEKKASSTEEPGNGPASDEGSKDEEGAKAAKAEKADADAKDDAADEGAKDEESAADEDAKDEGAKDEESAAGADKPSAEAAPKRKKKKKKGARAKEEAEAPAPPTKAPPSTGLMIAAGLVIAALVGGGVYLVRRQSGPHKHSVGDEIDVELTLVAADNRNLACAATNEVAGRHCAFEAQTKPWSKSTDTDDKKILKPYTTTDKMQLVAAGVWSEPALAGAKLPTARFSVKCKFKVEGSVKKPSIRWAAAGPWSESPRDWEAGVVSGCTLVPGAP